MWRGRISWRRLKTLVDHLPPESSLFYIANDRKPYWPVEAHLLDDLRMSLTGSKEKPSKPHPSRPKPAPKTLTAERRAALAAARARRRERLTQINP